MYSLGQWMEQARLVAAPVKRLGAKRSTRAKSTWKESIGASGKSSPLGEVASLSEPEGLATRRSSPPARKRATSSHLVEQNDESREQLLSRLLDPTLTLEEAAQVIGVCPTTVRRYTNRGILPHFRTEGNQRRFRFSHVLAFLQAQGDATLIDSIAGTGAGLLPRAAIGQTTDGHTAERR